MLMEITGLATFFSIQSSGIAFWRQLQEQLAGWRYFAARGKISSEGYLCSESVSNIWCCFSYSQDSWVQESMGGYGSGTIRYYPLYLTSKILLLVPVTLCSTGLEVLVPKGGMLPSGDTWMISLNWEFRLPHPLWAPHASHSKGKEGSYSVGWSD